MSQNPLTICVVCGHNKLKMIIDLGDKPLINNLPDSINQYEYQYPLQVNTCQSCTHQQLSVEVGKELLFSNYLYQTGTSLAHIAYFRRFVSELKGKTVLDIGCNDGSLLKEFKDKGWDVLGIDPAENLFVEGIEVIKDFFPSKKLDGKKFDCITAFNVFAHNSNPLEFIESIASLLNEKGRVYIQTTPLNIGNIYHEHISYFNPLSMMTLINKCNLEVINFKTVPMHGSSHLFKIGKKKEISLPQSLIMDDKPLIGYGAAANGMMILNLYGMRPEYVVDDNLLKQGKFVPGVKSPILSKDKLINDTRDLNIIILAYNLFSEIVNKIKEIRPNNKDTFIHPLEGVK